MIITLALKNIFRNTRRTFIVLLSITSSLMAIIFFSGFINFTFDALKENTIRTETGHIQIAKKGFFNTGNLDNEVLIKDPKEIENFLQQNEHVYVISRRLNSSGLITSGNKSVSALLVGTLPDREDELGSYEKLIRGSQLDSLNPEGCVLGSELAAGIEVKVGDLVTILSNTYDGSINAIDCKVQGIVETLSKELNKVYIKLNISKLQFLKDTTSIEKLVILVDDTENLPKVEKFIKDNLSSEYEYKVWTELAEFYDKVVQLYSTIFNVASLVLFIVMFLSIMNTMTMSTFERFREIGTIRAIGTTSKGIIVLFLTEGFFIGLIGSIIGVIAGILLALAINFSGGIEMPAPPGLSSGYTAYIYIEIKSILFASALAIVSSILSSIYPAYLASKKDIIEALNHV